MSKLKNKLGRLKRSLNQLLPRFSPLETFFATIGVCVFFFNLANPAYYYNPFTPTVIIPIAIAFLLYYRRSHQTKQLLLFLRMREGRIPISDFKRFFGLSETKAITTLIDLAWREQLPLKLSEDYRYVFLARGSETAGARVGLNGNGKSTVLSEAGSVVGGDDVAVSPAPARSYSGSEPQGSSVVAGEQKVCPFCGVIESDPDAAFCKNCGASFIPAK